MDNEVPPWKVGDRLGALVIEEYLGRDATGFHYRVRDGERLLSLAVWDEAPARDSSAMEQRIESLLAESERATGGQAKAELLEQLGQLYERELHDGAQALVAYTQAFCEDPEQGRHAENVERVAGDDNERWAEVLQSCTEATASPPARSALSLRAAAWHLRQQQTDAAIRCYRAVLAHEPGHVAAFTALAPLLRQQQQWLELRELLTQQADHTEALEERLARACEAAEISELQLGDSAGAEREYERVLTLEPLHERAFTALSKIHAQRSDFSKLVSLTRQRAQRLEARAAVALHLATVDGLPTSGANLAKAQLLLAAATLLQESLSDPTLATTTLERAIALDSTLTEASLRAADIAFEAGRHREAASHYQKVLPHLATLSPELARRSLLRQMEATEAIGSTEQALELIDPLLQLAPDDVEALTRAASLAFTHGTADQALTLCGALIEQHGKSFAPQTLATWTWRLGEAERKAGRFERAQSTLEQAADLAPRDAQVLTSLSQLHRAREDYAALLNVKERLLDLSQGPARADLLAEMGELASDKLADRPRAVQYFVTALSERPDDRRALTRLLAAYGESREWQELLGVLSRLTDLAEGPEQKLKYLLTAALLCQRELGDRERALELYAQVLQLEPSNEKALAASLELNTELQRFTAVEGLLLQKVERAQQASANEELLTLFLALGALYRDQLARPDAAIDAFEAARTLDPGNAACEQALRDLYATDPTRFGEAAIALQRERIAHDPFRADPYKELRRLYTELRRADPAWCLCQALHVLGLSTADEDQFFQRLRSDEPAALEQPLSDGEWQSLWHPDSDPLLSAIFALLEPLVLATRVQPLADLGYDIFAAIDVSQTDTAGARALLYVAGALGVPVPLVFESPDFSEIAAALPSGPPAMVMGQPALDGSASAQALVLGLTRTLLPLRAGFGVRHALASGTALKSWLFAAIRLNVPAFPVPAELMGPVDEALGMLRERLSAPQRDELTRHVARLLQSSSELDLRKWAAGQDFTADRLGLFLANDLGVVKQAIERNLGDEMTPTSELRLREIVLFAVSEPYFGLRRALQLGVDT